MLARRAVAGAVLVALAAGPTAVCAGQFDYSLYGGIEHSNNVALSTDNPQSANILIPGATFTYLQQGSTFQANVAGTVEYHHYATSSFDDTTQTELAATGNWTVVPNRLDFTVADYAGVRPVDSLSSDAPDNQQQTNVLTLGPILKLRFGDAMRGQVELHYINSYASKVDDFNSSRGVLAGRLFRDLSPTDVVSLNVETQRVTFQNDAAGSNYSRDEGYLRYTSQLAHFDADVTVGYSRLDFDQGGTESKPLLRAAVGWQPTTRSSFGISGAYQFSDAAQDLSTPLSPFLLSTTLEPGQTSLGGTIKLPIFQLNSLPHGYRISNGTSVTAFGYFRFCLTPKSRRANGAKSHRHFALIGKHGFRRAACLQSTLRSQAKSYLIST